MSNKIEPVMPDISSTAYQAGLIKPSDMPFVSKRWGWELWITNNSNYCGKLIFIKQGHWLSYHHHKEKDEVLYVQNGQIEFTHNMNCKVETIEISEGFAFHVTPTIVHQMYAIKDSLLIEFSTQHFDSDSYRITTERVSSSVDMNI
jgi:quercetin dioxygenase-like cupin family protein